MNTEKIAHWLTIVGNLGILAGLILVAIELNQNTASVRGAAYQTWVTSNLEINNATLNSDLSGAFWEGMLDPTTLTKDTNLPFALWTFGYFQMVQAIDYLYKSGSLTRLSGNRRYIVQSFISVNRASGSGGMPVAKHN